MNSLFLPLIVLAVLTPVMGLAWLRQRQTRNAGIVDLVWASSLGLTAIFYAAFTDGWLPRRILVASLVGLWSARLTVHLYQRVTREAEDGRYKILRTNWGEKFEGWLFWFFQAQSILVVLLSLTFLVLFVAGEPGWRVQDALAVALWLIALRGESIADKQLAEWRNNPANRGRTCRSGLWAFSRHPNYFFEWVHWLAYPILGIGLPLGWLLWLTPALMLFLVLKVTGIPPTEEQSLRSRGEDYRAYQRTTNAFFPGPRRAETPELSENR